MTAKMPALFAKLPPQRPLNDLQAIVEDWSYRFGADGPERHRRDTVVEFCAAAPTLSEAIWRACDSRNAAGKQHNHQSRVTAKAREALYRRLLGLAAHIFPEDFDHLYDAIVAWNIAGIGEVTAYDVATRIAAYLGWEVEQLYLHAGVKIGWRKLFPNVRALPLRVGKQDWPPALRALPADEVEDMLCAYRDYLKPVG